MPAPSWQEYREKIVVPNCIRYFSRDILNRVVLRSAGSHASKLAVVRHVGRRSRKQYETPILPVPMGKDFVIALTYWPKADWYHNLQKAGQGAFLYRGKTYVVGDLELIDQMTALPAFSPFQRSALRLLNIRYFARVTLIGSAPQ